MKMHKVDLPLLIVSRAGTTATKISKMSLTEVGIKKFIG